MKFLSLHSKYIYIIVLIFISILLAVTLSKKPVSTHTDHTPHIKSEYEILREDMLRLVKEQNPKKALDQIKEIIKTDDEALKNCHSLVHEIGQVSYDKYGDFNKTMEYYDNMCNAGYIHGVFEKHFLNVKDVFTAMKTVCNDQEQTVFSRRECYHGVGHGVMSYAHNDLPKALSICEAFEDEFKLANCINGVLMENFNTHHKAELSKFLDKDNPLAPCPELDQAYKADCYYYVPTYYISLYPGDYHGIFELCQEAEMDFVDWCSKGVGAQAVKDNLNNPKKVEEICMSRNESQKNQCLDGMIGLYMSHFREKGPEIVDCTILELSNREICETIKENKYKEYLQAN